jgi:hypothetical protein
MILKKVFGAVASIVTPDREASEEGLEYIAQLCDAADLSSEQKGYSYDLTITHLNRVSGGALELIGILIGNRYSNKCPANNW